MNVPSTAPAVPDDPAEVVTVLREAAAKAPEGAVRLLPGLADEAMDSWNVPAPEDIRAILRQVGGLRIGDGDAFWAWFFAEFEIDPCPPEADAEEQARNAFSVADRSSWTKTTRAREG
jgi:hypothetical protein